MAECGGVVHELRQTLMLGHLQLSYVLDLDKGGRWLQLMVMVVPTLMVDGVGTTRVWSR
jgi:hypothetical protein